MTYQGSVVRGVIATFVWLSLAGCTSMIERRIETSTIDFVGIAPVTEVFEPKVREVCNTSECHVFFDITDDLPMDHFRWTANIAFRSGEDLKDLSETSRYDLSRAPEENAPLIVIFPGYGTTSLIASMPLGLELRHYGYATWVVAGPTERQPFSFGLNGISALIDTIHTEHPNRPIITLGNSMGMIAATEFNARMQDNETPVAGTVLIAPMLDFADTASRLYEIERGERLLARAVPRGTFHKAVANVQSRVNQSKSSLQLENRRHLLPKNTLVLVSKEDGAIPLERILDIFPKANEHAPAAFESDAAPLLSRSYLTDEGWQVNVYNMLDHIVASLTMAEMRFHLRHWVREVTGFEESAEEGSTHTSDEEETE
ncbi:serine aminopeptidase domain-containing protein [Aliidiomarina sanyensis]|nr:alpha/beta hydrolase [Aliidiomarina sanyensis]